MMCDYFDRSNCGMTHSPDYDYIDNTLRNISENRTALEQAWEPRKLKLEVFYKLRTFERSAIEIIHEIDDWSALVEERTTEHHEKDKDRDRDKEVQRTLTHEMAVQELQGLDKRSSEFDEHIQQAFNRGGDLLQFLGKSSKVAEVIDVPAMCAQVTHIDEELTMRQEILAEDIEMYRLHLQVITRMHDCEVRGQQVSVYIQSYYRMLQSLRLTLLSVDHCDDVLRQYMGIEEGIRKVHNAVQQIQHCAEEIEHSDIDRADQASRLREKLTIQWENLQAYSNELVKTIKSGRAFFEFAERVSNESQM